MTINLHIPTKTDTLRPSITVIGVGGAGGNAVNNMINSNLEGVSFVVANTDAQALENSLTERRIQLGANLTRGLGAGATPDTGRAAAEEAMDEITAHIEGSNMVFITAGMGGGTGTGAAPVVARLARERGILTVGVVTKPFQFEGSHRMRLAESGLRELQQYVDTLIIIPNQNLFRIANEKTTFADAFRMADEVLHSGVRGVTDLMIMPGLINLDFADIRTVMREMGKAIMGTGEAEGAKRAIDAAEAAISNPLLDDVSMKGARGVLVNITGGYDMTLYEVDEATSRVREEVDPEANIIFGATFNPALEGKIRVSVVATGIDTAAASDDTRPQAPTGDAHRPFGGKIGFGTRAETAKPYTPPVAPVAVARPAEVKETPRRVVAAAEPPVVAREAEQPAPRPAMPAMPAAAAPAQPQPAPKPVMPVMQQHVQQAAPAPQANTRRSFARTLSTAIGAATQTVEDSSQQQKQQAARPAQQREPSFVSPAASQPAQRSFFSQEASDAAFGRKDSSAAMRPAQPRQPSPAMQQQNNGGSAMSFFQRMAGVSRALARPEPERQLQVVKKAEVRVSEQPAKAAEEDYLEIPAFLRRQAN